MKKLFRSAAIAVIASGTGFAAYAQHYTQINLVANTAGIAPVTDPSLINPWGLSRGSGSPWWVSDNVTGLSTLYNGPGAKQGLVVTIPPADPTNPKTPTGSPTGTIFNGSTTDFLLAAGAPATFLFSTIDGTIVGWNPTVGIAQGAAPPSTHGITVVKTKDGSSYTGLTSGFIQGKRYLYTANFTKGRVDVYDNAFHRVKLGRNDHDKGGYDDFGFDDDRHHHDNEPFEDERLPRNYVPFNVQSIGNDIVVTYALHQEGSPFETDGPGLGYVDIYSSTGQLLRRLEHGSWLNAPWGVALAPLDFGRFSHDLLIGQFAGGGTTESSGYIAAYDLATGAFDGLLEDATGKPVAINGIWGISPGNVSPANNDPAAAPATELYFAAGPNHGSGGLFGYLKPVSTELVKGNDQ
ncbi:TIGR03118 family protein [Acidobacterium sp. S8]|uniref:TIGR03118 family protein n=1 Tax=Acidobacterium sp. S8 TaxID=1641854 RepID=UPI00131E2DE7|nr:TIGR03118 family protein [Acidobacterium sp. S8]